MLLKQRHDLWRGFLKYLEKKKLLKIFLKLNNFRKLRITVISSSRWKVKQLRSEVRTCTTNIVVMSFQKEHGLFLKITELKERLKFQNAFSGSKHTRIIQLRNYAIQTWFFCLKIWTGYLWHTWFSLRFFSFVFSFMFFRGIVLAVRKTLLGFSRKTA